MRRRSLICALAALALLASAPHYPQRKTGSFDLTIPSGPFVAGSLLPLQTSGAAGRVSYTIAGSGTVDGLEFRAPNVAHPVKTTIVAASQGALAFRSIEIVPAPPAHAPLIAVATYESGIALHDPRTFAALGYVPIGGPPGDVTFDRSGNIYAPDTDGTILAQISRAPWNVQRIAGVASGNEVAAAPDGAIFITDRDAGGYGALTRVSPDGSVSRVVTGDTAEGLAIDGARGLVYAGNVNSDRIAEVDTRTMRVVRRIRSVDRTFGIALDARGRVLYAVSNTSPSMHRGGGYVVKIDLAKRDAPIVARSANMTFPLGAAFDANAHRLFVTDEAADRIYVLNARTLRAQRAPLKTCRTPWRPSIANGRLYVPCARANRVDVFDLRTLHRVSGAPFATGGFPLAVAVSP